MSASVYGHRATLSARKALQIGFAESKAWPCSRFGTPCRNTHNKIAGGSNLHQACITRLPYVGRVKVQRSRDISVCNEIELGGTQQQVPRATAARFAWAQQWHGTTGYSRTHLGPHLGARISRHETLSLQHSHDDRREHHHRNRENQSPRGHRLQDAQLSGLLGNPPHL